MTTTKNFEHVAVKPFLMFLNNESPAAILKNVPVPHSELLKNVPIPDSALSKNAPHSDLSINAPHSGILGDVPHGKLLKKHPQGSFSHNSFSRTVFSSSVSSNTAFSKTAFSKIGPLSVHLKPVHLNTIPLSAPLSRHQSALLKKFSQSSQLQNPHLKNPQLQNASLKTFPLAVLRRNISPFPLPLMRVFPRLAFLNAVRSPDRKTGSGLKTVTRLNTGSAITILRQNLNQHSHKRLWLGRLTRNGLRPITAAPIIQL